MDKEVELHIESCFIEAKPKKVEVERSYLLQEQGLCSIEINGQVGYLARGRASKAQYRRLVPWKDVKKDGNNADDNRWSDAGLTGVEKAVYYLKYGVLPEQRRLRNQVTIEELPAKSE